MTSTTESQSDGCAELLSGPVEPTTVTITKSADDSYAIELEGLPGACHGDLIAGCKLQTKCDLQLKSPLDPTRRTGTLQISWAFNSSGFTGSTSASYPPISQAPKGCDATTADTGKRR